MQPPAQNRRSSKIKNQKSKIASAAPELVPVKITGQSHELYRLQQLLNHKRATRKPVKLAGLGDILVPWYEKTIAQPGQKLEGIGDLWNQLVPPSIAVHARLIGFHRGTLTVALDHATVRSELDGFLRQGLLRQLQTLSKGAIFRIKTSIDGSSMKGAR